MQKVLHFGAGNIGRGLVGQLLSDSGYEIIFVDTNETIVNRLNEKNQYTVSYWDDSPSSNIKNYCALLNTDEKKIFEAIKQVELITISVTPAGLPAIGKLLAKGIKGRKESKSPLSIIACENMEYATSFLKKEIQNTCDQSLLNYIEEWISFPNSAIDRNVPNQTSKDGLSLSVEKYHELIIEKNSFKHDIPKIEGATFVDDLMSYVERKLFIVNNAHASVGYYSYLKGYKNIKEALKNIDNQLFLKGLLGETVDLLIKKYPDLKEQLIDYGNETYIRFTEHFKNDSISRICRNPLKKISVGERITKPTRQYIEAFLKVPRHLTTALAAGLLYNNEEDAESMHLQEIISNSELSDVITKTTGFAYYSQAHTHIYELYQQLQEGKGK